MSRLQTGLLAEASESAFAFAVSVVDRYQPMPRWDHDLPIREPVRAGRFVVDIGEYAFFNFPLEFAEQAVGGPFDVESERSCRLRTWSPVDGCLVVGLNVVMIVVQDLAKLLFTGADVDGL